MPLAARGYLPLVFAAAALAVLATTSAYADPELELSVLVLAGLLCAAGNLFEVFAPANFSFQPNLAVFFCASLFLPPWAVAVLAVFCFVPGWVVHRFPWYMVAFNVANYTLAGMAAGALVLLDGRLGTVAPDLGTVAALAGGALAFVAINHVLIALVVTLARGRPLRTSLEDMLGCAPIDLALAMTGASLAALWSSTPPLALLAAGPMVLMYRALWVPLLEHRSRTEPKTGLYNSEYLATQLEDALSTARRVRSGLSVVMIDLDQLRLVNNRHGHLAGDRLIRGVAETVGAVAAANEGLAARFGGDELCLLLPGRSLESAREITEQLRERVATIDLPLDDLGEGLAITVSSGIACYPEHADTVEGLLDAADAAVYDAKLGGRNRTRIALPASVRAAIAAESAQAAQAHRPPSAPLPAQQLKLNGGAPAEHMPGLPELAAEPSVGAEAAATEQAVSAVRTRLIDVYVGLLCAAALVLGFISDHTAVSPSPGLFVLLIGAVVLLDAVRIDVFERANLSPAAVPELALAYFFGPVGPIAAEGVIALGRAARRDPTLKWAFDFGALSLAGAAAAGVFAAFGEQSAGALLAAGVVAGIAYYIVNSGLLSLVMALSEARHPFAVWRERLAWMTPHYVAFGLLAAAFVVAHHELGPYAFLLFGLPVVMLWIAEKQYLDRSRASVSELRSANDELEGANARLQGLLDENRELLGRMHRSYLSTITSLARTVEAKDPYTRGHTERVAQIARLLAEELGFESQELRAVEVGSVIHDIGKIGVRDAVLLKPGPLTGEETREMRRHPETSSYILADLELPAVVKQMVRSHHERYDGTGYPDELAGEEIPLAARILSVADALDAMTSDRPYREALPLERARAEIEAMAGSQFCPRVVATLIAAIDGGGAFWRSFGAVGGDDGGGGGETDVVSAGAVADRS